MDTYILYITLKFSNAKAGDGNRTHVSSLEGWCSTIELHPHIIGVTGFEPATSWSQIKRSSQAEPHPVSSTAFHPWRKIYSILQTAKCQPFFLFFLNFLFCICNSTKMAAFRYFGGSNRQKFSCKQACIGFCVYLTLVSSKNQWQIKSFVLQCL